MVFIENEAVTMCYYAGTYMGICSYNLVNNFMIWPFAIKKFSFGKAIFKSILGWERGISKR